MDERAEELRELAALEREATDDARRADEERDMYEAAMDVFMAGCFLRVNDA